MRTQSAEIARKRLLRRSRALLRLRETVEESHSMTERGADYMLEMSDVERLELWDIRRALRAIDEGMFGRCEVCLRKIEAAHLERRPWVRRCQACGTS